ncbi:hypothetical protein ACSNOI_35880, partial [Actinomadura kijaniata]|uniref:hypothetical protein n=1 Tax=Actinomadura kijaniata TaxID=46161 RepID=UPI003F1D5D93
HPLVPTGVPAIARPGTLQWRPRWWSGDEALDLVERRVADPWYRPSIAMELDRQIADLGQYADVDHAAVLRRTWDRAPLRAMLREMVGEWTAEVASGSLPDLEHGLARLTRLAEYGYYDLEPDAPRPAPAAPAAALRDALRGGVPAELHFPPPRRHELGRDVWTVHHGDFLTVQDGTSFVPVFTPERRLDVRAVGVASREHQLWYDGADFFVTARRGDGWRTYRVVGNVAREALLTLDPETMDRVPDCPAEAETVLPAATAPSRVSYADGMVTFTAPDGRATARLCYPPVPEAPSTVYPPGWWARMWPVDVHGSLALRRTTDEQTGHLLTAALTGPATAAAAVGEIMPDVVEEPLRAGIAAVARTAAGCLHQVLRLAGALGLPQPDGTPAALRTRPGLPVARGIETVGALRRVARVLEEAAGGPDAAQVHPLGTVEVPRAALGLWLALGLLGGKAIEAARPWTAPSTRRDLLDTLAAWGNTPLGDGSGRWRVHHLAALDRDRRDAAGELWRTPSGAALILNGWYHPTSGECHVLEYSPDGRFAPLSLPGWRQRRRGEGQGWGGADRIAAFRTLLAERGPAPFPAGLARELAERAGFAPVDAAEILFGRPPAPGRGEADARPADVLALFDGPDGTRLSSTVPFPVQDAVRDRLMPDDPAALWDRGPDLDRAAARYRELEDL